MKSIDSTSHERYGVRAHTLQAEMLEADAALALQEAIRLSRLAAKTVDYTYTLAETVPIEYEDPTAAIPTKLKVWADESVIGMGIALCAQVVDDSLPQAKPNYYAHADQYPIAEITYYEVYEGATPAFMLNPADRLEQANNLNEMSQSVLQAQEEKFFGTSQ